MNLALMQRGYPPAVILHNDRQKYYDALNQANNGRYDKLELLIGQAIERALDLYLEATGSNEEQDYLPLARLAAADDCPYSQDYLSLLARRGRIDAFKQGRNWVSSQAAIAAYRAGAGKNGSS